MSERAAQYQKIWEAVLNSKKRVLVSHREPDGDAVASVLAARLILQEADGTTAVYLPGKPAPELAYLEGFEMIGTRCPKHFDLVWAFDYGDWERLEIDQIVPEDQIVSFDHHPPKGQRGQYRIIDTGAAATCEILYEFCIANNLEMTRPLAVVLLTGIMTDTGGLQHANTTARTLEIVEYLMLAGAPLPNIVARLAKARSLTVLKTWALLLNRARKDSETGVVYVMLDHATLLGLHLEPEHYAGFVSFLATIPGISAAVFLREEQSGIIQGSLRSEGLMAFNVSRAAEALGGGGHLRAAGFTFLGSLEDAWAKLRLAFRECLRDTK